MTMENFVTSLDESLLKRVHVTMKLSNQIKIIHGKKTTTLRTEKQYNQINLKVGEIGITYFQNQKFYIKNMGYLTINEAGGKDFMWHSEGFGKDYPVFSHTVRWLNGDGRLYVYKIGKKIQTLETTA